MTLPQLLPSQVGTHRTADPYIYDSARAQSDWKHSEAPCSQNPCNLQYASKAASSERSAVSLCTHRVLQDIWTHVEAAAVVAVVGEAHLSGWVVPRAGRSNLTGQASDLSWTVPGYFQTVASYLHAGPEGLERIGQLLHTLSAAVASPDSNNAAADALDATSCYKTIDSPEDSH